MGKPIEKSGDFWYSGGMISQEAIQAILGIQEKVNITPEEMADKLNVTFFPYNKQAVSEEVKQFAARLQEVFKELRVNVVPYSEALYSIPLKKVVRRIFVISLNNFLFFAAKIFYYSTNRHYVNFGVVTNAILRRKRIKPGISVIALGDGETGKLPMDHTSSFTESFVVTILDMPPGINEGTDFHTHFDTAMKLFARDMTNIVIAVGTQNWILYNFNASHPIYPLTVDFKTNVLTGLIPKIAAPIRPYKFSDFILMKDHFDVNDDTHEANVSEFLKSGPILEKAGLYPTGKKINELPFRNSFYRWIGKIHLDYRNGMSYGFLAWQMPTRLSELVPVRTLEKRYGRGIFDMKDYYIDSNNGHIFIKVILPEGELCLKTPDVWVLSQRSGSDKTHMNPEKDLIKMGLVNGKMFLQAPRGLELDDDYKPSFDTKVILSHAVGNAIIASIMKHFHRSQEFADRIERYGMALSHWHGYLRPNSIPQGWYIHGLTNPHVSCSSPQSAIYSISGKLGVFRKAWLSKKDYKGDVHIEPHHGTNVTFPSLKEFARFITKHPGAAILGNKHLYLYKAP